MSVRLAGGQRLILELLKRSTGGSTVTKKWTVMIYMVANKDAQLDSLALQDLREMERVVNDDIHVVVQIAREWPAAPQRFVLGRAGDGTGRMLQERMDDDPRAPRRARAPKDVDMGTKEALADFLTSTAREFEAENYFLVLWGHAYGLGFGRDHGDPLTVVELREALAEFAAARRRKKRGTPALLELLGANACAMSYAEAAYELRDSAQFMVASEIAVPFPGWPYQAILSQIDSNTTAESLGRLVVDAYMDHYLTLSDERVAMSLLQLDRAAELKDHIKNLTSAVRNATRPNVEFSTSRLSQIRNIFRSVAAGDSAPLIDLLALCDGLRQLCDDLTTLEAPGDHMIEAALPRDLKSLSDAAQKLREAVCPGQERIGTFEAPGQDAGHAAQDQDEGQAAGRLVLLHWRHPELNELHGLAIFAPFVTSDEDLELLGLLDDKSASNQRETGEKFYRKLSLFGGLSQLRRWPNLVYDTLRQPIGAAVMDGIIRAAAVLPSDRAEVAQVLLSVDSCFSNFDRAIAATRMKVARGLSNGAANGHLRAAEPASIESFQQLQLLPPPDQEPDGTAATPAQNTPSSGSTKGGVKVGEKTSAGIGLAVTSLQTLERAITSVEQATRKTLTNARFGLGMDPISRGPKPVGLGFDPGDPRMRGPKPVGLGLERPKPVGLGPDAVNPDTGLDSTSARLGPAAAFLAASADSTQSAALVVVNLFAQISQSLSAVEQMTGSVERTAADLAASTVGRSNGSPSAVGDARLARAFQLLQDASSLARQTLRGVISHPVQGFGPSDNGLDLETRLQLADTGGLNRRTLKLL
jgi:hypothetical protein